MKALRMALSRLTTLLTPSVSNPLPSTRNRISVISRVRSRAECIRGGNTDTYTGYMKKVKEAMKARGASEEEVKAFETGAQAYAKKIVGNFKDYDFYIGESMDPDGM